MAKAAVGAPATRLAGLGWRTWLLLLDIVLNVAFAIHGPFHAIDWWAYMDQVDHIVSGERDYEAIEGRTGPLVYPGGHVWIHVALHYISDGGRRVALLQAIYGVLQALNAWLVSGIYEAAAPPGSRPWLLCGLTYVAVRTRNVFVNGLFNDCWQVTLAHLALHAAVVRGRPVAAAFLLSLAVSVKMSALLYAPAWRSCCCGRGARSARPARSSGRRPCSPFSASLSSSTGPARPAAPPALAPAGAPAH
eukprot:tig00000157_g9686.t1